jgi:hypothetical protein
MVPIILNLKRIIDGGTLDNLIVVIIHPHVIFGGMLKVDIVNKIVCFGVDGDYYF